MPPGEALNDPNVRGGLRNVLLGFMAIGAAVVVVAYLVWIGIAALAAWGTELETPNYSMALARGSLPCHPVMGLDEHGHVAVVRLEGSCRRRSAALCQGQSVLPAIDRLAFAA